MFMVMILIAACSPPRSAQEAGVVVSDTVVTYDGTEHSADVLFVPIAAAEGATITYTPVDGTALEAGSVPIDVGVYAVHAAAAPGFQGVAEGVLTIAPRPVTITPDEGQSKPFGGPDPAFEFAVDGLLAEHALTGALGRLEGETEGSYAYVLGSLDAGSNYVLALASDASTFAIGVAGATVHASDAMVTYDGSGHEVAMTFVPAHAADGATVSYRLVDGDTLPAGSLPVDAGVYEVEVTPGDGFEGHATAILTIEPMTVVVTPVEGQYKVHGDADPPLVFDTVGLLAGAALTGSLARVEGESVGTYAFTRGTLDAGTNYVVTLADDTFAIAHARVEIELLDASRVYDGTSQALVPVLDIPDASDSISTTVFRDGVQLPAGSLPVDAGTYEVRVAVTGDYVGSAESILTIEPRELVITPAAGQSKTYGAADATLTYEVDGLVAGDTVQGALQRQPGEAVDTYAFMSDGLDAGNNYTLALSADTDTFAITPLTLELDASAADKVYDGSTSAMGTLVPTNAVGYDDVHVTFAAVLSDRRAGAARTVDFGELALVGADAVNYVLPTLPVSTTITVAPRPLAVTNVLWANKVYDGATGATASATLLTAPTTDGGIVSGDDVRLASQLVGDFVAGADVDDDKAVRGSFELSGADAGNYVVWPQPEGTAAILHRSVSLRDAVAQDKVYDGLAAADVSATFAPATGGAISGLLAQDAGALTFAAAFVDDAGDPTSGVASDVAIRLTLEGDQAHNYALVDPGLRADITARPITITVADLADKTYGDALELGTATTGFSVSNLAPGEAITTVTLSSTGAPVDAPVGTYDVGANDPSGSGFDAANYAVTTLPGTLVVLQRPITLSAATTVWTYGDPVLDGDLDVTLALGSMPVGTLTGALARTTTDAGEAHLFARGDADVRDAEDRSLWANYLVDLETYDITPRPLTITVFDRPAKVYGEALVLGTVTEGFSADGVAPGDTIEQVDLASDGEAAAATVGTYDVGVTAFGGKGVAEANYAVTVVPGSLEVVGRELLITGAFEIAARPYDGGTTAEVADGSTLTLVTVVDGDDVALEPVAAFVDGAVEAHEVGSDKPAELTVDSTLVGAHAGNYVLSLAGAPTSTGTVVKAEVAFEVTIAGTDGLKQVVYDGGRTFQPSIVSSTSPVPAHQSIQFVLDIRYQVTGHSVSSFRDVGLYSVTVTADDPRYTGVSVHRDLEVVAREITIVSANVDKVYGTADPDLTPSLADGSTFGTDDGFSAGALTYPGAGEPFTGVGSYAFELGDVTIRRSGVDVTRNYAITFADEFTITPATVTITPDADQGKVYGDEDPVLTFQASGLVDGDGAELTGALGRVDAEDVGTYAFTLGSLAAGDDYVLVFADDPATFAITPRPLTLTATTTSSTYGDTDLDLTALVDEGSDLRNGDTVVGALAMPSASAGSHTFTIGTARVVRDEDDVAGNYTIALGGYDVAPRSVTVTPVPDQGKVYGDADPVFLFDVDDLVDGDALTGTLDRVEGEDVGTYAFTLGTLTEAGLNDDYTITLALEAPAFTIDLRSITLDATEASRFYDDPDGDLSPVLAAGTTLRAGDRLVGQLSHDGVDASEVPYPLTIGDVQVLRESDADGDVRANYAVSFGGFTIEPKPVAFDIVNGDYVLVDGGLRVHVFESVGTSAIRGLEVESDPAGVHDFSFRYRHTHDADREPIDIWQQQVHSIVDLGTYVVTITATNHNYVGESALVLWVTDATHVVFAPSSSDGALVGASGVLTLELHNAKNAAVTAGPAALSIDVASASSAVRLRDLDDTHDVASVSIPSGAQTVGFRAHAEALSTTSVTITATPVMTTPAFALEGDHVGFTPLAELAFTTPSRTVGEDALSDVMTVALHGAAGQDVAAPVGYAAPLTADGSIVFRDAGDTSTLSALAFAAGAASAEFRVRGNAAGSYPLAVAADPTFVGVSGTSQTLTVTPKPRLASLTPDWRNASTSGVHTIMGSSFRNGATVSLGAGVTISAVQVVSANEIRFTASVAADAALGVRDLTVTHADGGTAMMAAAFDVRPLPPTVTSVNANSRAVGTSGSHTIWGTDFLSGATVDFGPGITITSVSVTSATSISVGITVAPDAPLGGRDITVTNLDGGTGVLTNAFTVQSNPQVTEIHPNAGDQGQSGLQVQVSGSGFLQNATLTIGNGVNVSNVQVVNPTLITATVSIASNASSGLHSVTVTNPDGRVATRSSAFEVRRVFTLSTCNTWVPANSGGMGVTEDVWSLSSLPVGATIDFQFEAYSMPDRWFIEYPIGTVVHATGWRGSTSYTDEDIYPGGITSPGNGEVTAVITYVEGQTQFLVRSEGASSGTVWNYSMRATCD